MYGVDRKKLRAMLNQPKQSKTLPVLNQGRAGYETEADLMYQAQQAADTLSTKQTASQMHPNFRTKLDKTQSLSPRRLIPPDIGAYS